jgi:hypothetical protein
MSFSTPNYLNLYKKRPHSSQQKGRVWSWFHPNSIKQTIRVLYAQKDNGFPDYRYFD